ncbi:hypothetical protein BC830DRAFT_1119125, partial [Chytriomyces sp. MP71]
MIPPSHLLALCLSSFLLSAAAAPNQSQMGSQSAESTSTALNWYAIPWMPHSSTTQAATEVKETASATLTSQASTPGFITLPRPPGKKTRTVAASKTVTASETAAASETVSASETATSIYASALSGSATASETATSIYVSAV